MMNDGKPVSECPCGNWIYDFGRWCDVCRAEHKVRSRAAGKLQGPGHRGTKYAIVQRLAESGRRRNLSQRDRDAGR